MGLDDYERVEVRSADELAAWLAEHHARDQGVWLITFKAHTAHYLPWPAMVQELLAWGWIDSTARRLDQDRTLRLVTPRRPGSIWSRINKDHVAALEAAGRLAPPGRAVVEAAVADGSWTLLDDVEDGIVPTDFGAALDERAARGQWDDLPWSTRRETLEWILLAKRNDTRRRRITQAADAIADGRRPR